MNAKEETIDRMLGRRGQNQGGFNGPPQDLADALTNEVMKEIDRVNGDQTTTTDDLRRSINTTIRNYLKSGKLSTKSKSTELQLGPLTFMGLPVKNKPK